MPSKLREAVDLLSLSLREDPSYRIGWQANIAMAIYDVFVDKLEEKVDRDQIHELANKAADNFLNLLT